MQHRLKQSLPLFFTLGLTAGAQFDVWAATNTTLIGCNVVNPNGVTGISGSSTAVFHTNLPSSPAGLVACTRKYWQFASTGCTNQNITIDLGSGGIPTPNFFVPNTYKLVCSTNEPAGTTSADYFTSGGVNSFSAGLTTGAAANFVGGAAGFAKIIFNSVTFSATTRYCVLCTTQSDQNGGNDLLVTLSSFNAISLPNSVKLTWKTAFELDNAGFHIWRSETRDGTYQRLTTELILADGVGSSYGFMDNSAVAGQRYYYKLEDIDLHGVSTFHDPITAEPNAITLLSPADNVTLDKNHTPALAWSADAYTSFKLQYSLDDGQTVYEIPTSNVFTPSMPDWQLLVEQLPKPTTLIWRVIGQDEQGNQAYSTIQHIIIQ
ncbi:hypothetical protein [Beggiatoa leptomitoformis]|uniref:Fibronectin type-III domain-containing protein n=1 Tax=Beggiatoa leptomitoformis TaxID=288004 RepID=A0A2N9YFQ2_9GAMM|nr:hypothetical protein [Beggiatoa leptomitoformis]ALG68305.1 hypothetical protein AL038_12025 [Beggiatoa leptomitoformis]AUI69381.1 hypothetical protein BLE401_12240 [Beggiatoa leptomitoformis]